MIYDDGEQRYATCDEQRDAGADRLGQGVAILSDMVHRPWSLEGRRIETMNISDPVPAMDVGLAWRRNMELTPPMLAFRSYFQQAFHLPER